MLLSLQGKRLLAMHVGCDMLGTASCVQCMVWATDGGTCCQADMPQAASLTSVTVRCCCCCCWCDACAAAAWLPCRGLYDGTAFYRLADRNGNPWYGMAKRRDAVKHRKLG